MTTYGWIFMGISWGGIILLVTFCISKLLKHDRPKSDE